MDKDKEKMEKVKLENLLITSFYGHENVLGLRETCPSSPNRRSDLLGTSPLKGFKDFGKIPATTDGKKKRMQYKKNYSFECSVFMSRALFSVEKKELSLTMKQIHVSRLT